MLKNRTLALKYFLFGIAIGLGLILLLFVLNFFSREILEVDRHTLMFSDWIIFISPILWGTLGWRIGHLLDQKNDKNLSEIDLYSEKSQTIARLYEETIKGEVDLDFENLELEEEIKSSLNNLKQNIQTTIENDKKKFWVAEGIAKFSDVLRSDKYDLTTLCDSILSNLVKYLSANQAGLFLVNKSQEEVLELVSCYAYERKKYLTKIIQPGQGLVGQAYLEKEKIWLKDVPSNYVNITSGLGKATPKNLVLFPLKVEDEVYGIIEISSFHIFEDHHFELLDRVGEIIASTIFSIQTNERTQRLLEESQEQTEQMQAQEEEMRQNMEELAASQEDTIRKEQDLQKVLEELKRNEIRQRIIEMSITIQSALEGAKKELHFLVQTPPIQGTIRARVNNGIDPTDGSTEEVWIKRLNVIIEKLLITKGLYQKVIFVDNENKLICGTLFDGVLATSISGNTSRKDTERALQKWQKDAIYIANPKVTTTNDFSIEMYIPVYHEDVYQGFVSLSLLGSLLLEEIKKREDEENKYLLLDGDSNRLCSSKIYSDINENSLRETIILNDKENFSMNIVHIKVAK